MQDTTAVQQAPVSGVGSGAPETGRAPVQRWSEGLSAIRTSIQTLIQDSADTFLQLGTRLSRFSERAEELAALSRGAADLLGGENARRSGDEISRHVDTLVANLGTVHRDLGDGLEDLAAIVELLETSTGESRGFRNLIKTLRVLGISTRIESARLGYTDTGFVSLAEDVEKLAGIIEKKSGLVAKKSLELRNRTSEVHGRLEELYRHIEGRAEGVTEEVRCRLSDLEGLREAALTISAAVAAESEQLSRSVGEVVMSLQFHDITRQQMEHVIDSLKEIEQQISADGCDGGEAAVYVGDIGELQERQLGNTQEEFVAAIRGIRTGLRGIADIAERIGMDAARSIGSSDTSILHILSELDRSLRSVISALKEDLSRIRRTSEAIAGVGDAVGGLTALVEDIEEIGAEIELIALNSRIKAAHTGRGGEALGVISEAIQKLSADARSRTEEVSTNLKRLADRARRFTERSGSQEDLAAKSADAVDGLEAALAGIKATDEKFRALEAETGSRAADLRDEILGVCSGIELETVVQETLGRLRGGLAEIVREARGIRPWADTPERLARVQTLTERYTMLSERSVAGLVDKLSADSSDELGDNVELF